MAKKKGNRSNGQAHSANHGSHSQKERDGGDSGKPLATKVAQLEVPEGYRPQRGKKNKRRRGKKLIASETSDFDTPVRELQQQTFTMMSITDFRNNSGELQVDLNPSRTRPVLTFNTDRKWVSIDNPKVYLPQYAAYQMRKYDPPVLAGEPADHPQTREFQRRRRLYFRTRGRLDRLAVLENVKDWPYKFGIPTRAPFIHCSENTPTENISNRDLPIFRAMIIPELASRILNHCAPHFQDLASFGSSCWTAFGVVQANTEHWNITDRDFLDNDTKPPVGKHKPNPGIVVVSPVRPEMTPVETVRRDTNYFAEFVGLVQLFHALNNRASSIVNLHLHRIPFLNIAAVECIIASLPNLQNLGLYQCRLLHFGTTLRLLEIIETHKKESGFVHLDFFPTFHEGPNSSDRKGSFGVTWEDPGLNTTAGILKLALYHHYPRARSMGFDLFDPSSAYRLWLEKCPLPDWTVVRAYEAVKTYEARRKCKVVNQDWMTDSGDPAFRRLADELAAAMFADDPQPDIIPQRVLDLHLLPLKRGEQPVGSCYRKDGWWRGQSRCTLRCLPTPAPTHTRPILEGFFPYLNQKCYGCRLLRRLCDTNDHFKAWQERAMEMWLGHKQEKHTLGQALARDKQGNAARYAWDMDAMVDFDKTNDHGKTNSDAIWRIDFACLRHRYHYHQEPRGPIDRRRSEWQYTPIGEKNVPLSFSTVTEAFFFHYFFSAEWYQIVARRMVQRNPGTTRSTPEIVREVRPCQVQCALAEVAWTHRDDGARIEMASRITTQDAEDRRHLLQLHREWQDLVGRPNRPARNWDEMRNRVFDEMERAVNNGRLIRAPTVDPQWTHTANHRG